MTEIKQRERERENKRKTTSQYIRIHITSFVIIYNIIKLSVNRTQYQQLKYKLPGMFETYKQNFKNAYIHW